MIPVVPISASSLAQLQRHWPLDTFRLIKAKFKGQPGYGLFGTPRRWHLIKEGEVWTRPMDELRTIQSVAVVPTSSGPGSRAQALKLGYSMRGQYLNDDTQWTINLFRDGVNDMVYHRNCPFAIFPVIPDIIKNAVHLATKRSEEAGYKWVHYFYVPVRIGKTYLAKLVVKERHDKRRELVEHRLYNISTHKTERFTHPEAGSATSAGVSSASEPSKVSIGTLIEAVKDNQPEHVPIIAKAIRYVARFK